MQVFGFHLQQVLEPRGPRHPEVGEGAGSDVIGQRNRSAEGLRLLSHENEPRRAGTSVSPINLFES